MRRVILLAIAVLLGVGAFVLPAPPEAEAPTFVGAADIENIAGSQGSVWYCPWMNAGAVRDAFLMVATETNVQAEVTLPSPIPNEEADRAFVSINGPGAEPIEIASIVRRGDAPGFVELTDGPAGVSAMVTTDSVVAGDRCVASVPKLWHLTGGTTRPGRTSIIRLFNPFPEPAKVTVEGSSEFGEVGLLGLTSIDVPGRSWLDVNLNELVPLLDDLSLTVLSEEGLVIPSIVVAGVLDEATWPGTGLSTTWEFPVTRQTGLVPNLIISNPGDLDAEIEIDVYRKNANTPAARAVTVPARSPLRVPLGDLGDRFFAIRVRSDEPIAAVVVAEDTPEDLAEESTGGEEAADETPQVDRIAGTVGTPTPATQWLLTGPGGLRTAASTIWILNTHADPVTVTLQPLGTAGFPADKVTLEAESVQRIVLPQGEGVSGYLLEAPTAFSAAWSVEGGDGVAFVSGISIDG